jgi:hypothetical protein
VLPFQGSGLIEILINWRKLSFIKIMNDAIPDFSNQKLVLSNELLTIEIQSENDGADNRSLATDAYDYKMHLNEDWTYRSSLLSLKTTFEDGSEQSGLITGIDGGFYLHSKNEEGNYSVKLEQNTLFLSLGFSFFSFDLVTQNFNWLLRPDIAEVFEFYDLEGDFLLRGETEIHRISKNGDVKWSYRGEDIWVNMDSEREVNIRQKSILLKDFNSKRYLIDFGGNTMRTWSRPVPTKVGVQKKKQDWWKIWK